MLEYRRPRSSRSPLLGASLRDRSLKVSKFLFCAIEGRIRTQNGWMMIHVSAQFVANFFFRLLISFEWVSAMYSTLCYIEADTAKLCRSIEPQAGILTYYEMSFDVVLSLGLTEFKAHVCWMENVSSTCCC